MRGLFSTLIWNIQMSKNLVASGDRLIVKRTEAETTTPSGLIIPTESQEKLNKGEILSTGELVQQKDLMCKGNVVHFGAYAGTTIQYNNETYLILKESDVLAVEQ